MSNENQHGVSDDAADGQSYDAVDAKNNDGDDAASIVGRMAGLGAEDPPPAPVPPSALVARFCGDTGAMMRKAEEAGSTAEARDMLKDMSPDAPKGARSDAKGYTRFKGFCGYGGGRGDMLVTGFDDGYSFMGYLGERGWRSLHAKGDWPYVVWMRWPGSDGEPETLIEYCEADLGVWQFDNHEAAVKFYNSIKEAE